jgi:SWIM zinc finger
MDAEDVLIKYDPPFLMALKRSELRVVPELFFPTENKFSGFREAGEYAQSPHSTDNPGESLCARGGLRMQREEKGRDIATHRLLERKGKLWEVPSQSGKGKSTVDLEKPSCTCPDFAWRGLKCKHIYAVQYTITPPTEASNTPTTVRKTGRATYRQDWPSYNAAQIHEKAHFQSLLHDLCQGIKEPAQNKGRPRVHLREAVFSAGFKVYSAVSTRRFMSDLVQASAYGYISSVPH